ncbi:hypothetical protein FHT76_000440 [Rhizobium sp. BK176]|nr:hypothetical protein [Rhizobium sp. BK176]
MRGRGTVRLSRAAFRRAFDDVVLLRPLAAAFRQLLASCGIRKR